jgi:transposase-like protein
MLLMWHAMARPLAQIAKDFGLLVTTLKRWIAIAERRETGAGPPTQCTNGVQRQSRRRQAVRLVVGPIASEVA